jgi:hypothetical protein
MRNTSIYFQQDLTTLAIRRALAVAPTSREPAFARGSAVLQYVFKSLRAAGLIRLAS